MTTKRILSLAGAAVAALFALTTAHQAAAHCQVPCGIYDDEARFTAMLEDAATVEKAIAQINELASKDDALSRNQLARWVVTKESHADNIQHVAQQYFLAQRIKAPADDAGEAGYVAHLKATHTIIVAAMKCKQTVDAANAAALKKAIEDYKAIYFKK